jgi:flagellar hook-length control protein FliK
MFIAVLPSTRTDRGKSFMSIAFVSALFKSALPSAANVAEEIGDVSLTQDFTSLLFGQMNAIQVETDPIPAVATESLAMDSEGRNTDGKPVGSGDMPDWLTTLTRVSPEQRGDVTPQEGKPEDGDQFENGGPLNILTMLARVPPEQRDDVALPEERLESDEDSPESGSPSDDVLAVLAQVPLERRSDVALPEKTSLAGQVEISPKSFADERIPVAGRVMPDAPSVKPAAASEPAAKFAVLPDAALPDIAPGERGVVHVHEPAGLSVMAPGTPSRVDGTHTTISIPTPLHDRGWSDDFAQKVSWIVGQRHQSAELTLNPPAMGNIEISIRLDNDKSTVVTTFVSANAEVRETLETALPRLREMLASAGIELGQTHVSAESFRQTTDNGQNSGQSASRSKDDMAILTPDSSTDRIVAPMVDRGRGLVDMFV